MRVLASPRVLGTRTGKITPPRLNSWGGGEGRGGGGGGGG